jgi:hypothetical protein
MGVLGVEDEAQVAEMEAEIATAEMLLTQAAKRNTLNSADFRDQRYATDKARQVLRKQIKAELLSEPRCKKDDDIRLGYGGALPIQGVQEGRQAFLLIGLPASGKSAIASEVAESYNAIILDSDYAKRKFPEFTYKFGADLVHKESALVVFGDSKYYPNEVSMIRYCVDKGYNLVIPKVGNEADKLLELADELRSKDYQVHLTLVDLDRAEATRRAYQRYIDSKRYVSLTLIFDSFANEPALTYYRLKEAKNATFSSYGSLSTAVPRKQRPKRIAGQRGNPALLYKK